MTLGGDEVGSPGRARAVGRSLCCALLGPASAVVAVGAAAHGVDAGTGRFLQGVDTLQIGPFLYIGAKHMVTGYDHLLFLFGVVFLLTRARDVVVYVSLFTLGHSLTLISGVLLGFGVNAFLIDALIGLSVVYKGFDNLGGFQAVGSARPNPAVMVFGFGLVHGLGLATKLLDFELPRDALVGNLLAFNVGVELGQLLALSAILTIVSLGRRQPSSSRANLITNTLLMAAGVTLMVYQLTGFFLEGRT